MIYKTAIYAMAATVPLWMGGLAIIGIRKRHKNEKLRAVSALAFTIFCVALATAVVIKFPEL